MDVNFELRSKLLARIHAQGKKRVDEEAKVIQRKQSQVIEII